MEDYIKFKGHFTVQTIDKESGVIVDEYAERQMIMEAARTTMAKIFSQLVGQSSISKIVLGTYGHAFDTVLSENIVTPKTSAEGFVKERNRLFSEYLEYDDTYISVSLKENDLIKYTGTANGTGTTNNYYVWAGADATAINISTTDFSVGAGLWKDMGSTEPFTYKIQFDLPQAPSAPLDNLKEWGLIDFTTWNNTTEYAIGAYVIHNSSYYTAIASSNIGVEPGVTPGWESFWTLVAFPDSGSTGDFLQSGSSVTFTFDVNQTAANNGSSVIYTEAALYAGNDIFAMKTFKAKIKDDSVLLRIIWTITF